MSKGRVIKCTAFLWFTYVFLLLPQVPEITFDSQYPVTNLSFEQGRLAAELEFLLSDIKNTIDLDFGDVDMSTPIGSLPTTNTTPFTSQDDITFYDDSYPTIKAEKVDSGYEKYYSNPSTPSQSQGSSPQLTPQSSTTTDPDMDEAKKEVDDVCLLLDIPADPNLWTQEQVLKWAKWTLDQYKLPMAYVDDFQMDGPTLTNLTGDDFLARSPAVGEYLFAQLEFWKSAFSLTTVTCTAEQSMTPTHTAPEVSTIHLPTTLTYTNLDCPQPSVQHPTLAAAVSNTDSMTMATASNSQALNMDIPKPVFSMPLSLSPSPSLDSMDGYCNYPIKQEPMESSPESKPYASPAPAPKHEVRVSPSKQNIHLWQFLRELLLQPQSYSNCIRWIDRARGIFKIEDSQRVARLWGQRKNRPAMNYDKLSRSIRQYYKKGIIRKTDNSKRLVYQFCPPYRA